MARISRTQEDGLNQAAAAKAALVEELGELGWFRRGSLLQVLTRCSSPGCRCRRDPAGRHGPYWQWTRKVKGKTVTVRLNETQVALLREWLANAKRLDQKLGELEVLSAQVTDRLLAEAVEG